MRVQVDRVRIVYLFTFVAMSPSLDLQISSACQHLRRYLRKDVIYVESYTFRIYSISFFLRLFSFFYINESFVNDQLNQYVNYVRVKRYVRASRNK